MTSDVGLQVGFIKSSLHEEIGNKTLLVQHMVDKKIKELCSIPIPGVRINWNEATGDTTSEEKMK